MRAYRFQTHCAPAAEIRRVALEQLERAIAEITAKEFDDVKRIHSLRKRFKKLRSLFRLVASADREFTRRENERYRELGGMLSSRRDADVMLSTIDALSGTPQASKQSYPAVRKRLSGARDSVDERDSLERLEQSLHEAREAMLSWSPPAISLPELVDEFLKQYRRARSAFQRAGREKSSEVMHRWRKRTKDHWYQMRLLRGFWSGPCGGRIKRLRKLSLLQGEEHDLAVLSERCDRKPKSKREARELAAIQKRIARKRTRLRKRCQTLGRTIFGMKPKSLRRKMKPDRARGAGPDCTNEIAGPFEVAASGQHFA